MLAILACVMWYFTVLPFVFPWWLMILHDFCRCFLVTYIFSFVKCLPKSSSFKKLGWVTCTLCIWDTSPLSDVCIVNVSFQFVPCLFVFLTMSFNENECFVLIKFSLSIFFSSYDLAFCDICKNSLLTPRSKKCSSVFCSRNFMVLYSMFVLWSILNQFLYIVWSQS